MDPLSVAVSVASLLGASAGVIKTISDLKSKYSRAHSTLSAVSVECAVITATLAQFECAVKGDLSGSSRCKALRDLGLAQAIRDAFECCDVTLVALADTLRRYGVGATGRGLSWGSKVRSMFKDQELQDRLQTLRSLNQAMTALFTVMQADSVLNINQILNNSSSTLKRMSRHSGTLKKHYEPSIISNNDRHFDFDDHIVNSQAYRRAFRLFVSTSPDGICTRTSESTSPQKPGLPEESHDATVLPTEVTTTMSLTAPTLTVGGPRSLRNASLRLAAEQGQVTQMKHFLKAGTDIDAVGTDGYNALHLASKHGHLDCIRMLIAYGANVEEIASSRNLRALHVACEAQQVQAVHTLLTEGHADIHAPIASGNRPLNLATVFGNLATVKVLVDAGANVEAAGVNGWTPLQHAAFNSALAKAAFLLERGAKVDLKDMVGNTALHFAARKGPMTLVELLVTHGADPEACNNTDERPIHCAAAAGYCACLEALLEEEIDRQAITSDGSTPLHLAAIGGHTAAVEVLVKKGADVKAAKGNGNRPLNLAAFYGSCSTINVLIDYGAAIEDRGIEGWTALLHATANGKAEVVKLLLKRGARRDAVSDEGHTVLQIAEMFKFRDLIEPLLGTG